MRQTSRLAQMLRVRNVLLLVRVSDRVDPVHEGRSLIVEVLHEHSLRLSPELAGSKCGFDVLIQEGRQ